MFGLQCNHRFNLLSQQYLFQWHENEECIPIFRDYKNPDLVKEEGNESDSDYDPDIIEESSLKRKRPVARKSTTPGSGKRGKILY